MGFNGCAQVGLVTGQPDFRLGLAGFECAHPDPVKLRAWHSRRRVVSSMPSRLQPAWSLIGASVRGAAHVRASLPNQDAIGVWSPAHSDRLPGIVVVSDGHGSAKCFRSDKGARRAVRAANTLIRQFLDCQFDLTNLSAIKRTAEERLHS